MPVLKRARSANTNKGTGLEVELVNESGRPTSLWAAVPLDDDWVVSYRVVRQGGSLVIGEVRVFPRPAAAQGIERRLSYEWTAGDLHGVEADVPTGGVVARLLRAPTLGAHVAEIQRTIAWSEIEVAHARAAGLSRRHPPFGATGMFGALGIEKPRQLTTAPGRSQAARRRLAKAAAVYVQALAAGSRKTTPVVAARLRISEPQARDLIHRARVAGILDPPKARQGRPEGRLTPYGRSLLDGGDRLRGRR